MIVVKPSFEIMNMSDAQAVLKHIELCGRTCYKSEGMITEDSADPFIRRLIKSGHLSVIEHSGCSVRFIVDRGVSHELVRHRLCSFSQESTRYCQYNSDKFGNEITFIDPVFWKSNPVMYNEWYNAMLNAEKTYNFMTSNGATAQEARSVLPNSLKTDIVVTANMRQWRLVLQQRVAAAAHPQAIQAAAPVLKVFIDEHPAFFEDMTPLYENAVKMFHNKGWEFAERVAA